MRFLSVLFAMLFVTGNLFAGGNITGQIRDEKNGEPIIGATVIIKGTSKGAATDVDGNFTIAIEAGTYTVQVNYIGYQTKEIDDVKVADNVPTELNVSISESKSKELQEVVVKASLKKENINSLYIMQKNSISVSSGISADIIQRTPDKNTGEVLKRVSGASIKDGKYVVIRGLSDRYNIAMVNNALMPSTEPDKKAFSFDIIPSNVIDNIIINKTASADMPGDFAGGVVQVLTKDVPEKNFVNAGISVGYNTQSTFKDFVSNERGSTDFLAFPGNSNALPSSFGDNYKSYNTKATSDQVQAAKLLPNSYNEVKGTALPITSLQVSAGNVAHLKNGGKFGTILGLNYRNSQVVASDYKRGLYEASRVSRYSTETQYRYSTNLSGIANLSYVKGKSKFSLKNLYNKIYDNTYYQRVGYSTSFNQQFKLYSSLPSERQMFNTQLEGDHSLGEKNTKLNWNLNYSNLSTAQKDMRTAFYSRNITFDDKDEPVTAETIPYEIIDRNSRRFFSTQTDNNFGGNFKLDYPFQMFGNKQHFKAGYLGVYKVRTFEARIFQYEPYTTPLNHNLATLPVGQIFATSNIGPNGFRLREITNSTDKYDASGLLNAGFLMLDNTFGSDWRLSWGVRFESYTQNLQTTDLSSKKIDKTDVFNDVLPSMNLSYSANDKTKIRLSASRTVNRPEFREIAPFQFTDFENLWTITGNPNLTRGNITNVDFRYEYYMQPGEVLSAGAFYKHFTNPIEAKMDDQSNLDLLIFTYQNAKAADAVGAEIELRKNLSFISDAKWLENFIVGGNFTYIYSKVDASNIVGKSNTVGTKADRPLQGQSPYLANVSLLYNDAKHGWAASAMYNRIGHRIAIVGSSSIPTTWENGRDIVDLQLSKTVLKNKGELKLTVADLFNQPTTYYWNTSNKDSYQKGSSKAGNGNDQVFQQYKLGTTFTVGFNYKFGK